ncbi:MAG: nucleoside-diphosphate sugar epimerase/dehydratase [Candidatus Aphodocola sp.]
MKSISNIANKKNTKIAVFIFLDLLALIISSMVAIGLRFDFSNIPTNYFNNAYLYLVYDFIIMIIIFVFFKLYTSMWTYASIIELIDIIFSCLFFECATYAYKGLFGISMPRSYFIIQILLLILFVCMSRFSFRFLRFLVINIENKRKNNNTMIIGAGSAGKLLINEINNNQKGFTNKIKCIIDDDKNKKGTYINGIAVE